MKTRTRAEVSKKNKFYVEKNRYYELKYFCLQYPIWKQAYESLDGLSRRPDDLASFKTNKVSDPTSKCAEAKLYYLERMNMVEKVARETDSELCDYILKGVTEGIAYDWLKVKFNIPCGKDTYYKLRREFFWRLNKIRE